MRAEARRMLEAVLTNDIDVSSGKMWRICDMESQPEKSVRHNSARRPAVRASREQPGRHRHSVIVCNQPSIDLTAHFQSLDEDGGVDKLDLIREFFEERPLQSGE